MRTALLHLARAERTEFGFVTNATREHLSVYGIGSVEIEQYLAIVGDL